MRPQPHPTLGQVAKSALEYRIRTGFPLDAPCDIYESIVRQGVDLRFMGIKSLEGFYLSDGTSAQINVCTFRPSGLQRFIAAHELAHHVLGHGSTFDPQLDHVDRLRSPAPEERLAELFARYLLMPRKAVYKGLVNIGANLKDLQPADIYRVASWLGVGYGTLLHQMRWSLQLLDQAQFDALLRAKPQTIKQALAPCLAKYGGNELWPAHSSWDGSHIHAQIGDVITGVCAKVSGIVSALEPACCQASSVGRCVLSLVSGGHVQVSVSRKEFIGFYENRYLPEPEDA
jgi:Zn-dependent peptidase ImmA (M78 family)